MKDKVKKDIYDPVKSIEHTNFLMVLDSESRNLNIFFLAKGITRKNWPEFYAFSRKQSNERK